jgi:hypothetical protein
MARTQETDSSARGLSEDSSMQCGVMYRCYARNAPKIYPARDMNAMSNASLMW